MIFTTPLLGHFLPIYYKGKEIALLNGLGPSYKEFQGQIFNQFRKFKQTWLIEEFFLFTETSIKKLLNQSNLFQTL